MTKTKTKKELVKIDMNPEDYGLSQTKAKEVSGMFTPMLKKMEDLENEYNEVVSMDMSEEKTARAKELRLQYVKVRTGTAAIHKELKSFYLKAGRFIDGWKNAQLMASEDHEKTLKEIEDYYALKRIAEQKELQSKREGMLSPYIREEDFVPANLFTMDADTFKHYLAGVKKSFEERKAAEKAAEEERLRKEKEEAEERERIRKENAKLKAEAEAAEKARAAEREKARKEEEAREEARRKEREAEEKRREEIEKKAREQQEKLEAQLKAEAESREKAEKEIKDRQDAEKRAAEQRKKAGDGTRLKSMVEDLEGIKIECLLLKSKDYRDEAEDAISNSIERIKNLLK